MNIDLGDQSIRSYRADDLEALILHANDPQVARTLTDAFPHPYRKQDAQDWIKKCAGEQPKMNFAIVQADALIGGIGLIPQPDVHRIGVEMGYWLGRPFWGQGIMTGAVRAFADWTFLNFLQVQRLQAGVYASNPASGRVLEKAGFLREACLRRAVIKNNQVLDLWIYARFRDA